jgi:hypothetical protein
LRPDDGHANRAGAQHRCEEHPWVTHNNLLLVRSRVHYGHREGAPSIHQVANIMILVACRRSHPRDQAGPSGSIATTVMIFATVLS